MTSLDMYVRTRFLAARSYITLHYISTHIGVRTYVRGAVAVR